MSPTDSDKTTATEAPAKKAAKTAPKAPAKTAAKKGAPTRVDNAALARKVIEKKTGQKTITANYSTYPHVASGSFAINDLIGGSMALDGKGQICPGYPRRRITEVYGPGSSGKTTIALHAVAEVQKAGGLAMFLDFEHALDHGYAKKIGVSFKPEQLLLYAPDTFEEGVQIINIGLQAGVDLIVVDSVPSMVPKEEMEGKLDKEGRFGALARALGKNLPKLVAWLNNKKYLTRNAQGTALIMLNQQRANIGGGTNAPKAKTAGGYALKFYASVRLMFTGVGKENVKRKNRLTGREVTVPFGTHTQVKVVKNKIDAKQGATHTIFIRFGQGIDEVYSLIEAATYHKVVQKKGSFLIFKDASFQGREKFRKFLLDNPKVFNEIRKQVLSVVQADVEEIDPDDLTEEEIMERGFDDEFGSEEPGSDSEVDESEVDMSEELEESEPDSDNLEDDPEVEAELDGDGDG